MAQLLHLSRRWYISCGEKASSCAIGVTRQMRSTACRKRWTANRITPPVLAELAKTYDLMQLYDRANEMWRKLQGMGPSAGAAYELADRRLKLGVPTPAAAPMPDGSGFFIA